TREQSGSGSEMWQSVPRPMRVSREASSGKLAPDCLPLKMVRYAYTGQAERDGRESGTCGGLAGSILADAGAVENAPENGAILPLWRCFARLSRSRIDGESAGCSSAWLERYVRVVEAAGSNPVTPI